jgi:hypothetical protein
MLSGPRRVGGLDQAGDGPLRIAGRSQRVPDGRSGDHGRQAVGAQQVPVTRLCVVQRKGGLGWPVAVDGPQQQRPLRVGAGLRRSDVADGADAGQRHAEPPQPRHQAGPFQLVRLAETR